MANQIQHSLVRIVEPDVPWDKPLSERLFHLVMADPDFEDQLSDLMCDIVQFTIDVVGVKAVLDVIPDDWECRTVESGDNPTKEQFAWWWLWERLMNNDVEQTEEA